MIQWQDFRAAISVTQNRFLNSKFVSNLCSPLWDDLSDRFQKISIVTPSGAKLESRNSEFYRFPQPYIRLDIGIIAVENELSLNDFYFSRVPKRIDSTESVRSVVLTNDYELDTIYVYTFSPMWILAKINHREQDLIGLLDGLPVLLPGLASCTSCDLTGFESKV